FLLIAIYLFFFFTNTATTEIYTLSLHDALPILPETQVEQAPDVEAVVDAPALMGVPDLAHHVVIEELALAQRRREERALDERRQDRKSTRLNSSHSQISYAVFCLKKKKNKKKRQ